jgi:hypothetical protein
VNGSVFYTGGLVGQQFGTITDSYVEGKIYCGVAACGGFVGNLGTTFSGENTWVNHSDDHAVNCIGNFGGIPGNNDANCSP